MPHTLTHAAWLEKSQQARNRQKRQQSCGSELESCRHDNEVLYAAIGWRPLTTAVQMLECDEYPWAASEEGGNYLPESQRSRLCVPRVQNNYGGQCVEMMSNLQSNVGKMEPVDPPKDKKRVDMWASWCVPQNGPPFPLSHPLRPLRLSTSCFCTPLVRSD